MEVPLFQFSSRTNLIDGLEKLADDEGNRLNALDFLLRVKVLLLQVPLLVLDVLLLHRQELKLLLQLLVPRVLKDIICMICMEFKEPF